MESENGGEVVVVEKELRSNQKLKIMFLMKFEGDTEMVRLRCENCFS